MSASSATREEIQNQKGHRARQRKKLTDLGAERLSDKEILEMLLYYALPRVDTKPIANTLLDRFGSIENIINADPAQITDISGIKDNVCVFFALLKQVVERTSTPVERGNFFDSDTVSSYLKSLFFGADRELVYALFIDENGNLLDKQLIFSGNVSSAKLSLRPVTEGAIRTGGNNVIIAHNHPSGSSVPSSDDIYTTNAIGAHLSANEINLVEHYIVTSTKITGILKA